MGWVDIVVAIIGVLGVGMASYIGYKQFKIKRDDEKEAASVDLKVTNAIQKLREEMMVELEKVSLARSEEGAKRFETHAVAIEEVNRQISENSKQIAQLTTLTQDVLEQMGSINKAVTVSAESQKNTTYDRLLIITNKILKSKFMTIADKTNLRQMYQSWKDLHGEDPKLDTRYEECMKLETTFEED